MAHILIMPRQGNTVESCILSSWKIKEGDKVSETTSICDVETDKAAFEVPAGTNGTVLKLLYNEGDDIPVLSPIAVIGEPGETYNLESRRDGEPKVREMQSKKADSQEISRRDTETQSPLTDANLSSPLSVSVPLREPNSDISVSPRARLLAEKEALPLDAIQGSGPEGRIIERDVKDALSNRPALTAAAKAAGGAMPNEGSGLCGRITLSDRASSVPHSSFPIPRSPSRETRYTDTPIKGIRKIISDRMMKSLTESAQFTLNTSANAKRLQDLRSRMKTSQLTMNGKDLSKISLNDMILFAVSRTLPRFLYMNAHKLGETIRTFENIHLGFAVDTPRGLMVPVIRNCDLLTLAEISEEAKRLVMACQEQKIKAEELTGSTFTISNLGSLGITSFTPILNTPEIAILGVCGIENKLTGNCKCCCNIEPHIGFSLTIDHQAVDGAPAARFLKVLCDCVADIDLVLAAE